MAERESLIRSLEERTVPGIRDLSRAFLLEALGRHLDERLSLKDRDMVYRYFGTDIRLSQMATENKSLTYGGINYRISTALMEIWEQLPLDLQEKYPPKQVVKGKTRHGLEHSKERRRRIGKALKKVWQREDYQEKQAVAIENRKPASEETKTKLSEVRENSWTKPEYRRKQEKERSSRGENQPFREKMSQVRKQVILKRQEEVDAARTVWDFAQSRGLLPKIKECGLLSADEMVNLEKVLTGQNKRQPIAEELLIKFLNAVAAVR